MTELIIDRSKYKNALSRRNQIARFAWTVIWAIFARPIPRSLLSGWKRFLLRCFGAKIHRTAVVYSSARIFMPWHLEMDEYACLGPEVDCYNVTKIKIGTHATVSQKSYLCSASHEITDRLMPLITAPVIIEDQAWIGADAFIGMGVTVGQGTVNF